MPAPSKALFLAAQHKRRSALNFLSKLTITQLKRPTSKSPQDKRRDNLISKLSEQSALAQAEAEGKKYSVTKNAWSRDEAGNKTRITRDKLIRPWYFQDGGVMSLVIRYGARPLELAKGKRAVTVANLAGIPEVISTIIAATKAGELDAAMEAAVAAGKPKPARN